MLPSASLVHLQSRLCFGATYLLILHLWKKNPLFSSWKIPCLPVGLSTERLVSLSDPTTCPELLKQLVRSEALSPAPCFHVEGFSQVAVPEVWPLDQGYQHPLGTC